MRRYASAQELHADLQRFLAGAKCRPRPLGVAARAWRRCRRRPAIAALAGAMALVTVVAAGGIAWQWRRAVYHADQVERSFIDAEENLVNWAWVLEELHHMGYSNEVTNHATRDRLKQHYQALA